MATNNMDMMALGDLPTEDINLASEARGKAQEIDSEMDSMNEDVAPEGKWSARSLHVLIDAINKILPLFSAGLEPIQLIQEDMVGKLPTPIVKAIVMINKAANDASLTNIAPSLDSITDNRSLEMVAARIILLAKNRDFVMFLKANPHPDEENSVENVEEKGNEEPNGPQSEDKMNSLFMSRV